MKSIGFLILISLVCFTACSKKKVEAEPPYTAEEFQKVTEHLTAVNPTGENAIPFPEYSPKVNRLISKTFVHERLKFYAIGFDSVEDAKNEAKRLNQYYARNYLFDQVEGEPILEDMVITTFHAQNPNRTVQRVPKKSEHGTGHGEGHSEGHGESHGSAPAAHH